jgi:hypothetical protein
MDATDLEKGISPSGLILAHNHVRRFVKSPHGANGFRRWRDWPPGSDKKSRNFGGTLTPSFSATGEEPATARPRLAWSRPVIHEPIRLAA